MERFVINDTSQLHSHVKSPCDKCGRKQNLFCKHCIRPISPHIPPTVELPIQIDIFMDACENSKKSTALHIPLISCRQTQLFLGNFRQNGLPLDYIDNDACLRTLLLYPSNESQDISEIEPYSFDK